LVKVFVFSSEDVLENLYDDFGEGQIILEKAQSEKFLIESQVHKHPKRVHFRHSHEQKVANNVVDTEGVARLRKVVSDFLQKFFEVILLDLGYEVDSAGVFFDLFVAFMKVEVLETDLKGITFGKAIRSGGDSLLFEVFVKADAVGIMFIVNVSGVKYKFPFFEYGMGYDLFELDFFIVFEEESLGVKEHIFVTVDDKIMGITLGKVGKFGHELVEESLFLDVGVSLLATDERPTSHYLFG
jgi:hypothetical protein